MRSARPSIQIVESEAHNSEISFNFMPVPGTGRNKRNSGIRPIMSIIKSLRS